jgi:ribosomal protein L16 Arg81 hydroxylase
LAALVDPVEPETFMRDYWQQKPLVLNRGRPAFNDHILTLADIDALLTDIALPTGQVDMGQSAVGVPKQAYDRGGYVDAEKLLELHKAGKTIIMRAMELWSPKLRRLCLEAGRVFHAETQTNLYLTPSNTNSSYPHWDSHDLFIIQLAGRKTWRVHEAKLQRPLPSYRFDPARHEVGGQVAGFTLEAGDIAYLPRGLAHDPAAHDYSVHISLGVLVKTWADLVLDTVTCAILEDERLREALPLDPEGAGFDLAACAAQYGEMAGRAVSAARVRPALEEMSRQIRSLEPREVSGQFAQYAAASSITLDSVVEVAAPAAAPERADGRVGVMLNGIEFVVAPPFAPALEFVASHRRVKVADIPAPSDAHRVAFAQKLAEEGCLAAAPAATP